MSVALIAFVFGVADHSPELLSFTLVKLYIIPPGFGKAFFPISVIGICALVIFKKDSFFPPDHTQSVAVDPCINGVCDFTW